MSDSKINIILADDHTIVREGLHSLIESNPEFKVIAHAENGQQAIDLAKKQCPDVIMMDATMPDVDGINATKEIIKACPECKIIAISMHEDKHIIMQMLKAGAKGYLHKDCNSAEITKAIKQVLGGKTYLCSSASTSLLDDYISPESAMPVDLTKREKEVLTLLAEGKSSREAAEELFISIKTVQTYTQNLMRKLNVNSIAELTKYAIKHGLTTID